MHITSEIAVSRWYIMQVEHIPYFGEHITAFGSMHNSHGEALRHVVERVAVAKCELQESHDRGQKIKTPHLRAVRESL